MNTSLKAAAFLFLTTLGVAPAVEAATVASVDASWLQARGFLYEIETAGNYTLDFSGEGRWPIAPDFLGTAAYAFAEFDGGIDEFFDSVTMGMTFVAFDGLSINLGFLDAGVDFAAAIIALGGDATLSLNRVDDPAPVPLPGTLPLLAASIGSALFLRRRNAA